MFSYKEESSLTFSYKEMIHCGILYAGGSSLTFLYKKTSSLTFLYDGRIDCGLLYDVRSSLMFSIEV